MQFCIDKSIIAEINAHSTLTREVSSDALDTTGPDSGSFPQCYVSFRCLQVARSDWDFGCTGV
jgi:hypothetical protein